MAIAKRFATLVRLRIICRKTLNTSSLSATNTGSHCDSIGGSAINCGNTEPHACESGTGKAFNSQTHDPPSSRDVDECDWIDTLVTRSIGVNDISILPFPC